MTIRCDIKSDPIVCEPDSFQFFVNFLRTFVMERRQAHEIFVGIWVSVAPPRQAERFIWSVRYNIYNTVVCLL